MRSLILSHLTIQTKLCVVSIFLGFQSKNRSAFGYQHFHVRHQKAIIEIDQSCYAFAVSSLLSSSVVFFNHAKDTAFEHDFWSSIEIRLRQF